MNLIKEPPPPRKRAYHLNKYEWKVGDEAEHEWTNNDYRDVFHPIRFVAFDKNTATVKMLAFTEASIITRQSMSYFHPYRIAQPNYPYQVGDRVHFKMYGRKVRGQNVDGDVGMRGEGVWVKGVIIEINQEEGQVRVRHVDWSSKKPGDTQCWVERRDLRPEQYNL